MFKRLVTSTLLVGAVMSLVPAMASAEEFRRDRDRDWDRDRARIEYRERIRHERIRGYYDRFGCWHRY